MGRPWRQSLQPPLPVFFHAYVSPPYFPAVTEEDKEDTGDKEDKDEEEGDGKQR